MEYGIGISFFCKDIGFARAAELVAKAGFKYLDYTPPLLNDDWKSEMRSAMAIFAANGLTVYQTHAPFNRYRNYGDNYMEGLERCAEATEIMGAKYMVAHGDEFDFDKLTFTPKAAIDYNRRVFLPYVERAEKSGYKIAFETVFDDMNKRRYTSRADELLTLIKSFDSPASVCCWDFGHAHVAFGKKAPAVILELGSLIECTHLHDNAGNDSHQMPLTGDIDWTATKAAFDSFGYSGIMSVEYAHGCIPAALKEDFINLTFKTSKYIWG